MHLLLEAELESAEQRMRDTFDQLHQGMIIKEQWYATKLGD